MSAIVYRRRTVTNRPTAEPQGPWLVQAYRPADDMRTTVPQDVVELTAEQTLALALPPGKYRLLVTSLDGAQRVAEIKLPPLR